MTGVLEGDIGIALVNILLLSVLFVVAISIARLRNLFAIVMLSGIYSLVSATWYVVVDAVDVAFTEAAVGAGMSTVVLLGAMLLTWHNLHYYQDLMAAMRKAIADGTLNAFAAGFEAGQNQEAGSGEPATGAI